MLMLFILKTDQVNCQKKEKKTEKKIGKRNKHVMCLQVRNNNKKLVCRIIKTSVLPTFLCNSLIGWGSLYLH